MVNKNSERVIKALVSQFGGERKMKKSLLNHHVIKKSSKKSTIRDIIASSREVGSEDYILNLRLERLFSMVCENPRIRSKDRIQKDQAKLRKYFANNSESKFADILKSVKPKNDNSLRKDLNKLISEGTIQKTGSRRLTRYSKRQLVNFV
jgi:hypothetical protein